MSTEQLRFLLKAIFEQGIYRYVSKGAFVTMSTLMKYLWNLNAEEFNEWRRKNDLPKLFDFLSTKLPGFDSWLESNQLEISYLPLIIPSGDLFRGDRKGYIVEFVERNTNKYRHKVDLDCSEVQLRKIYSHEAFQLTRIIPFIPYFRWAKDNLPVRERRILIDPTNKGYSDTFVYNSWEGINDPTQSKAHLFQNYPVLKLGGVILDSYFPLGGRNLDFTNLDYLVIQGDWHGGSAVEIAFSSCCSLKFMNAELHHFYFYQCHVSDFICEQSEIQSFVFEKSQIQNMTFRDSRVFGLILKEPSQSYNLNFLDCRLSGIQYLVPDDRQYLTHFDNCRSIRVGFQSNGKRDEASYFYYLERCYERKSMFNPYIIHCDKFPPTKYNGRLWDIIQHWRNATFTTRDSLQYVWYLLLFHVKIWTNLKYMYLALMFKLKYVSSLLEYLVWGYGEKPGRILLNSVLALILYTTVYYFSGSTPLYHSLVNSIYFSAVTFTTLGYGDITPTGSIMKLVCASEALMGALFIGLIIAGFSNRSKY